MSGHNSWNPAVKLEYNGPYPRHLLQNARTHLIYKLRNPSYVLAQVLPSCGITTKCGRAKHPPPPGPAPPSFLPPQPTPSASSSSISSATSRRNPEQADLIVLDSDEYESDIFNDRSCLSSNKPLAKSGVIVLDSDESESDKQYQSEYSKSNNFNRGRQRPTGQRNEGTMKRKGGGDQDYSFKKKK